MHLPGACERGEVSGSERGQLRLITNHEWIEFDSSGRRPTQKSLDEAILRAAHDWAELAMQSSEAIDTTTEEGQRRMALIDAVHDAEYHAGNGPRQPDLFSSEPPTT